ncbi:hypothetical protein [Pseudoroseicyclus sp. CXY001]|uniref:hypothetical protein n=1 Tax=Pseudoroseicyclus sp. CXY001 TaxID=3242492 RepID=UPI0035714246
MRLTAALALLPLLAACEMPPEGAADPAAEAATEAETSPELQTMPDPDAATTTEAEAEAFGAEVLIGPGATEADFIASLSDAELYPELTPEGAAIARVLFYETPQRAYGAQLAAILPAYDCDIPVTDSEADMLRFEYWAGTQALARTDMPARDIPLVAADYGSNLVQVGMGQLETELFTYDDDNAIIGLSTCA